MPCRGDDCKERVTFSREVSDDYMPAIGGIIAELFRRQIPDWEQRLSFVHQIIVPVDKVLDSYLAHAAVDYNTMNELAELLRNKMITTDQFQQLAEVSLGVAAVMLSRAGYTADSKKLFEQYGGRDKVKGDFPDLFI